MPESEKEIKLILSDTLDDHHPNWVAIKPGLYVRKSEFQKKKYFMNRYEVSNRYLRELSGPKGPQR